MERQGMPRRKDTVPQHKVPHAKCPITAAAPDADADTLLATSPRLMLPR